MVIKDFEKIKLTIAFSEKETLDKIIKNLEKYEEYEILIRKENLWEQILYTGQIIIDNKNKEETIKNINKIIE